MGKITAAEKIEAGQAVFFRHDLGVAFVGWPPGSYSYPPESGLIPIAIRDIAKGDTVLYDPKTGRVDGEKSAGADLPFQYRAMQYSEVGSEPDRTHIRALLAAGWFEHRLSSGMDYRCFYCQVSHHEPDGFPHADDCAYVAAKARVEAIREDGESWRDKPPLL